MFSWVFGGNTSSEDDKPFSDCAPDLKDMDAKIGIGATVGAVAGAIGGPISAFGGAVMGGLGTAAVAMVDESIAMKNCIKEKMEEEKVSEPIDMPIVSEPKPCFEEHKPNPKPVVIAYNSQISQAQQDYLEAFGVPGQRYAVSTGTVVCGNTSSSSNDGAGSSNCAQPSYEKSIEMSFPGR